ncbi:hypothetical protein VSVS12_02829 [Vibrio scophthalmi]|uniref:hypothetical protein n=1 Tax=Vibrio scophthalmi TaxID=45658 RepID=UPI0008093936|nr:hypothetical protein [Vibrio scophthalmi]ANS86568.1 hypothetical protein VSVS12_02829 [Vibrio scophthalmi]
MSAIKEITTLTSEHNTNTVDLARLIEGEWYYVIDNCGCSSVGQWQSSHDRLSSTQGDGINVTSAKEIIKVAELRFKNSREFPLLNHPFVQRRYGFKILMEVPQQGFTLINVEQAMDVHESFPFNYTVMP